MDWGKSTVGEANNFRKSDDNWCRYENYHTEYRLIKQQTDDK